MKVSVCTVLHFLKISSLHLSWKLLLCGYQWHLELLISVNIYVFTLPLYSRTADQRGFVDCGSRCSAEAHTESAATPFPAASVTFSAVVVSSSMVGRAFLSSASLRGFTHCWGTSNSSRPHQLSCYFSADPAIGTADVTGPQLVLANLQSADSLTHGGPVSLHAWLLLRQ